MSRWRAAHAPPEKTPARWPRDGVSGGFQDGRCDTADRVFDGPKSAAVADGAARVAGFGGVWLDALRGQGTGLPRFARNDGVGRNDT